MFYIGNYISPTTLKRFLHYLHNDFSGSSLYIYLNSVGGCTRSSMAMFEIMRTMSDKHQISVVTQAFDDCFSASLVLFLAGDLRYATKHAKFMIHEVQVGESAKKHAEGYKTTAIELQKETTLLFDMIHSRVPKLSVEMMRKKVKEAKDNDWTFGVPEAKKLGIVTHSGFFMPDLSAAEEEEEEEGEDETETTT